MYVAHAVSRIAYGAFCSVMGACMGWYAVHNNNILCCVFVCVIIESGVRGALVMVVN